METEEETSLVTGENRNGDPKAATNQNGKTKNHSDAATEKEREALLTTDVAIVDSAKKDLAGDNEPRVFDKYNMVYIIMLLHGVGTLMPWNMFITAEGYFTDYKLMTTDCEGNQTAMSPDTNLTLATMSPNETCTVTSSIYRNYFLSSLGFVAQIPNVLLNAINVFAQVKGGSTSKRIIWSIIIIIIMFIITVAMAMIDSSNWPEIFFWVTMVIVVIINMANGVYQNSVYGTAAILPMRYTNAVVLGSNISGTLTSIIMIISLAATPDMRTSAIYYFLAAIFILVIAFDTYFALPLIKFYRHHKDRAEREQKEHLQKSEEAGSSSRPPFGYIFKACWKQFIGVWLVFFVTLTCFPAIQAGIKKVEGDHFPIPEKYFTPVTCFLFFNAFAMLGNLTTEWIRKPGPRWVWIPIVLRLLFIPFFMFCNFIPKSGERGFPVFIPSNWAYVVGGILMAFSSGYFSSLTMMYAPRELKEPEYQGVAGMMAAFFLILGIFSGVIFSLPVTIMVEKL